MLSHPHPRHRFTRVALLTTRRAPGLEHLLGQDPERGRRYELVAAVVTDPESPARDLLAGAGVPVLLHDLRRFCAERGARTGDLAVRREFDAATAALLAPYRPDLVIGAGYLHILTTPMLSAYPGTILNIHDADLTRTGTDGLPRFRGLHATRDAILAGERETRSTVHRVTDRVDVGPIVCRSAPYAVAVMVEDALRLGAMDLLRAYAYAHREWMMRTSWGPLLSEAILRAGAGVPAGAASRERVAEAVAG